MKLYPIFYVPAKGDFGVFFENGGLMVPFRLFAFLQAKGIDDSEELLKYIKTSASDLESFYSWNRKEFSKALNRLKKVLCPDSINQKTKKGWI